MYSATLSHAYSTNHQNARDVPWKLTSIKINVTKIQSDVFNIRRVMNVIGAIRLILIYMTRNAFH